MEKAANKPPRKGGTVKKDEDKLPTYQEALDEAVEQSFPASDPIAPGGSDKADREISTGKDEKDWARKPGAGPKGSKGSKG
jgi:hypothetical protein